MSREQADWQPPVVEEMALDLDGIAGAAEAASDHEWLSADRLYGAYFTRVAADHIATADPPTVLALVARAREADRLEEENARLRLDKALLRTATGGNARSRRRMRRTELYDVEKAIGGLGSQYKAQKAENARLEERVRELVEDRDLYLRASSDINEKLVETEAFVRELKEALRPFGTTFNDTIANILWGNTPDDAVGTMTFRMGDFRRANRLLARTEEPADAR